jgi:hypothetical protein
MIDDQILGTAQHLDMLYNLFVGGKTTNELVAQEVHWWQLAATSGLVVQLVHAWQSTIELVQQVRR